jgi:phosphatidylglycerol:prolipoprotein diacylglycerol transferase
MDRPRRHSAPTYLPQLTAGLAKTAPIAEDPAMHPTLVHIGPLPLHSYGFMLAISFFLGILLASRRAPGRGLHPDVVFDTSLVIVFAAILGARGMYVLFHRNEMHGWMDALALWSGGLTMYGGVLAAMAASWYYLRHRKVRFLQMADIVAPSLALGLGLTRIGCFLNGCCYGKPTTGPFGVHFPPDSFVARLFDNAPVHPTQLYSSVTGLVILGILLLFDRVRRPEGHVFALFLILDAIGRFVLDFYRSYEANVYILGPLTVNQVICIGLFVLGILLFVRQGRMPVAAANETAPASLASASEAP